jgi:hypothetical protein
VFVDVGVQAAYNDENKCWNNDDAPIRAVVLLLGGGCFRG